MRVVVQECAKRSGKSPGTTSGLGVAIAALLALTPAHGQIAGANNVPGNLRPTILTAPNGVPLVMLQAPSAAGVSRNIYSQFDVPTSGVVLGNNRTAVQTQLGGWVAANPQMAAGSARVIVNEINSGNASQIRGMIEVAGPRAEVIVANPAGISISGGFINASKATITTGQPQYNAFGGLEGYVVRGGTVSIDDNGLDARTTDYAAILARAVQVNAGIWASDLKVVTGSNDISVDAAAVTPIAGAGPAPAFALDVAQIGGMYANKIFLVGNEAGLGFRNAGSIQAASDGTPSGAALMGVGQLVVTSSGHIENSGTLQAAAEANISAPTLANSGHITSGANLRVATDGNLANSGTLEAPRIEIASAAGDIVNAGTIRQTSTAGLMLAAPSLSNTAGGFIGAEPPAAAPAPSEPGSAAGGSNSGSSGGSGGTGGTGSAPDAGADSGAGNPSAPAYVPPSPGSITAANGTIRNDGGKVYAGGPITLQTPQVNNTGGALNVAALAVSGPAFSNAGGTLNVANAFSADVGSLDNSAGQLRAGSVDIKTAGDFANQDGTIESNGDVVLDVGGSANNQRGAISAAGALTAKVAGAIQNMSGTLAANQAVSVSTQSLDNTLGSISSATAGTSLAITNALTNYGAIAAATDLSVQARTLANVAVGTLRAGNDALVTVTGSATNDGSITAGQHITVNAASLQGTGALGAGINADGTIGTRGDLRVTTAGALAANGTNLAAGDASLQGASVDLSGSQTGAANIAITATQGNVTTSSATVATAGTLSINANSRSGQTLVNQGGKLNAGQLDLHASNIDNTNGEIVQTGTGATTIAVAGSLNNSSGRIASNGALVFAVVGDFNQDGGTTTARQITIDAGSLGNRGGTIAQTGADATRITVTGELRNDGGSLQSNGDTTLTLGSLSNRSGVIATTDTAGLNLGVNGSIDNTQGAVIGGGTTIVSTASLDNTAGQLSGGSDLTLQATGTVLNQGGVISANQDASLTAAELTNTQGQLGAGGELALQVLGQIANQQGLIASDGGATVRSTGLDNSDGRLSAGTSLDLQLSGALANDGGLVVTDGSANIAAGSLTNRGGQIGTISGDLQLDVAGLADNTSGLLQSGGRLQLSSSGLANHGGTVSGKGVSIDTRGGSLDNTTGKLLSAGDLSIASGELGNASGRVGSDGALAIRTSGPVNNAGGRIESFDAIGIDTQGHDLLNQGGRIVAFNPDTLRIDTGAATLANTGGLIRTQGDLDILAGTVTNNATKGEDQGLEGGTLKLTGQTLNNQDGAIRSMGDATIVVAEANNASGSIVAGDTLNLSDATGLNLRLDNSNGELIGVKALNLGIGASTGTNAGRIASGGDISLRGGGDWTNSDVIEGNGNITYDFAGTLTNNGTLSAGETLIAKGHDVVNNAGAVMEGKRVEVTAQGTLTNHGTLEAADTLIAKGSDIVNGASGLITAGNHTYLDASGSLTNHGTIDGEDTQVRGGSVTNTSRIYGTWLSVGGGGSVVNEEAGVIAARNYLDLGADTIVNRGELLSEGGMTLAGGLDATGIATGKASSLRNESALISANDSLSIHAADIQNVDTHLTVERVTTQQSPRTIITVGGVVLPEGTEAMPAGAPGTPGGRYLLVKQPDGSFIQMGPGYTIQVVELAVEEDQARNAKASHILAGGDIDIDGRLTNRDSQVLAGGTFTANAPVVNAPTQGQRKESGTSSVIVVGTNPNTSGDLPLTVTPIDNPPTTYPLTDWDAPRGGGAGVNNKVSGPSGGGTTPGGSAGPSGPTVGSGGGSNAIIEVPSAVGGVPGVTGKDRLSGANADGSGTATGPDGAPASGNSPLVVRTATPNSGVPRSSLFNVRPETTNRYLVETDPRYANYRQWLSSDYLLNALSFDPNSVQKRLGDGYYEQRLIRDQVAQLTGYRYLEGFASDEEQYTALMNAGVTFAQQYHLTPGIALTAEQMAQLTSDIVWLVEQTVTLPDGSTQKVLVPQVYVRVRPGDIDGHGTLLSADKLRITGDEGAGDIVNKGTIAGRTLVELKADNIRNLDGGRISGGTVNLEGRQDVDIIGSTVDARNAISIKGGRDVNVTTTTATRQTALGEVSTKIDRVAGLYVTGPNGTLGVEGGRDVNLTGAVLVNRDSANPTAQSGLTHIKAGRDIDLDTVTESQSRTDALAGGYQSQSSSRETGTVIATNGMTHLEAGQDINARQADVNAGTGLLIANAGRNINIVDGQANDSSDYLYQSTKKGTFSSTTTTISASEQNSKSVGSSFQGGVVALHADNNVNVVGSKISGTQGVSVTAGNEVNVVEGRDTHTSSAGISRTKNFEFLDRHLSQETKTGNTIQASTDNAAASSITSSQGGVYIEGGNSVYLRGAQVEAAKDVTIKGGDVTIVAAVNEARLTVGNSKSKNSSVTSALHGLKGKSEDIQDADVTSLARSTLNGANVSVTATGDNGTSGALTISGTAISTPGKVKLEGDSVNLATQATESVTSRTGGKSNLTWQSTKDSGTNDEKLHYNQINAGSLEVHANRVTVDMNAKDSVEALAQQPGMGWLAQIQNDPELAGKVDWQKVEEAHKQWDYGKSGLTPEGAAVVTAVVTYLSWGAASGLGATAGSAVGGGTTGAVVGGAVTAGVSALASQASIALINNKGDLGKTLDDLGSSANVKALLTAIATGGVLGGLNLNPTGLPTTGGGASPFMDQLRTNLTAGAAKAVISTAINGGSLEDALTEGLKNAFLDTIAAQGAFAIGSNITPGSLANALAHAIAGCAVGAARTDGSCGAGALGAAIGELAASLYDPNALNLQGDTVQFANMVSSIAAAIGGLDANEINLAGQAGANAAANNWLATQQKVQREAEMAAAETPLDQLKVLARWGATSFAQDELTKMGVGLGLVQSGISDVKGLLDFLSDPVAGLNGLHQLLSDPNVRQQLGDSVFGELDAKINRMQTALDVGGAQNAVQLGQDLGSLIYQVGTVVTGAAAGAKGGMAVANAAVKIAAGETATLALTSARMETIASQLNNFYRDGVQPGAIAPKVLQEIFDQGALASTHNAGATEVVLGSYVRGSAKSYEAVAQARGSTFFSMSDWSQVSEQIGASEIWGINRAFLEQQISQGKSFVFTSNPALARADSFTNLEYAFLRDQGYSFIPDAQGLYHAIK